MTFRNETVFSACLSVFHQKSLSCIHNIVIMSNLTLSTFHRSISGFANDAWTSLCFSFYSIADFLMHIPSKINGGNMHILLTYKEMHVFSRRPRRLISCNWPWVKNYRLQFRLKLRMTTFSFI